MNNNNNKNKNKNKNKNNNNSNDNDNYNRFVCGRYDWESSNITAPLRVSRGTDTVFIITAKYKTKKKQRKKKK